MNRRRWMGTIAALLMAASLAGCSDSSLPDDPGTPTTAASGLARISTEMDSSHPTEETRTQENEEKEGTQSGSVRTTTAPGKEQVSHSGSSTTAGRTSADFSSASSGNRNTDAKKTTSNAPVTTTRPAPASDTITVTFSVECHQAVEAGDDIAMAVSDNGVIQAPVAMTLKKGSTAFDALQQSGLVVAFSNTMMGTYVTAIQSLAAGACGPESGWLYLVDGTTPGKSCSRYVLQDGDVLCWSYTLTSEVGG